MCAQISSYENIITFRPLKAVGRRGEKPLKGVVNCQNSRDKGPPEGNSARG